MQFLSEFTHEAMRDRVQAVGGSATAAYRLLRAFYRGDGEFDPRALSLGKAVLGLLEHELRRMQSDVVSRHDSADGTVKLLIRLSDGATVEAVMMPSFRGNRAAVCVSSQVGCAMGCDFCATAKAGFTRNLTAGEIVEQLLHLRRVARTRSLKVTRLVFMGMGEPLLNLGAVSIALDLLADQQLAGLGYRNIAVSTVGIVPGIDALATRGRPVHLALSLHAGDDATRAMLVPANRRYPVREIMDAARRYQSTTGRLVNIEYCMLAGVNDSADHAETLAGLLGDFRAHVNLIPHNPIGGGVSGRSYARPSAAAIAEFSAILAGRGVVSHVRVTRGDDVSAACGQLKNATFLSIGGSGHSATADAPGILQVHV